MSNVSKIIDGYAKQKDANLAHFTIAKILDAIIADLEAIKEVYHADEGTSGFKDARMVKKEFGDMLKAERGRLG